MKSFIKDFKNWAIKSAFRFCEYFQLIKKSSGNASRSKFLVISSTGVGDTLWGTLAIQALKKTYPQSYLGVLVSPLGFQALQNNPNIDEYFIFRRGLSGFFSWPFLMGKLKKRRIETAFIFHSSDRVLWPMCYFAGPSAIIGFAGENKGLDFILTKTFPNIPDVHGVAKRLKLVQAVGIQAPQGRINFFLTGQDREMADRFLEKYGIDPHLPIIGIHPGAQKPFKCWPAKNFIAVGNGLQSKLCGRIIITGDEQEKELAQEIANQVKNSVSAAGKLSLRGTAALIEKMKVFITNDTGPMHIAFALNTPTVALFSPTDSKICGPYGNGQSIVIEKPKTCSPCIGKNCKNPICMEQITPEEVIAAAERLWRTAAA